MTSVEDALAAVSIASPDPVVRKLKDFCLKKSIPTTGAIAITIQRNRTGDHAALIVDFENETMHTHYPVAFSNSSAAYKEGRVDEDEEFLYCYHAGLDATPLRTTADAAVDEVEPGSQFPFCCNAIVPYRPRRTVVDSTFAAFVQSKGTVDGLRFEVKRQVNNGRLLSTKMFELRNGVQQIAPETSVTKVHSFKNYKCNVHNRFFGVDLYKVAAATYNRHHLRCLSFSRRDTSLEEAFFEHHCI
jgi:hypothetical protein